jgi:hypothetical protein
LIPAHFFLRKKFSQLNKEKEPWGVVILVAVMAIIIMVITGSNWGAAARLGYPGLAFLLLLLFAKIDDAPFFAQNNLLKILTIIGFSLNAVAIYYSINSVTPDIITLAGVERRASTISTMQIVLHRPVVTFAGVDMGGLLLYHGDGKKIIDLGLLCDRELGKNGYAHLEEYLFQKMKPEIIEAHGFWLEPLRNTRSFKTMYIPVMVLTDRNEQILYLRKDILAELKSNYEMPYATARAGFKDIDQATLEQLGSFPVLNLKSTQ